MAPVPGHLLCESSSPLWNTFAWSSIVVQSLWPAFTPTYKLVCEVEDIGSGICAGSKLAVACDDGCLRLFTIQEGQPGLVYSSSFPPLKSRLLSVAWHPNGQVVCTGTSEATVHAWHVATRREMRIHTGVPFSCPYVRLRTHNHIRITTARDATLLGSAHHQ